MNIFVFCGNLNKVGGVTESVSNFIRAATSSGHSVRSGALAIFKNLYKYDFSYINYSRPYKRLIAALLSRLYAKKTVVVYHGLYDFSQAHLTEQLAIHLSDICVLLNEKSYRSFVSVHGEHKAYLQTSLLKEGLRNNTSRAVDKFSKIYNVKFTMLLYCSLLDMNDTYGVDFVYKSLDLLRSKFNSFKVILVDPNSSCSEHAIVTDSNVIHYNHAVDFDSFLKSADIYIRPTCKDGNSVAINEALMVGCDVLASDVVDRPVGVHLYKWRDQCDFVNRINDLLYSERLNYVGPSLSLSHFGCLIKVIFPQLVGSVKC